jgi:hypothetical protein
MQFENLNEPASIVAAVKSHPGLLVLRESYDGNEELFWLLDMTAPEFECWWREREEFGRLAAEGDPILPQMVLPCRFLSCWPGDGKWEPNVAVELWYSFLYSNGYHLCQICCDADSFLITPDGRSICHRGCQGHRMPDSKPFSNNIPLL